MSNKSPSLDDEIARWHRFGDDAIGDRYALMALFLATVSPELKGTLHDVMTKEFNFPRT